MTPYGLFGRLVSLADGGDGTVCPDCRAENEVTSVYCHGCLRRLRSAVSDPDCDW